MFSLLYLSKNFNKLHLNKLKVKDVVVTVAEPESVFDKLLKTKSEKFDQKVFERRRKIMQRGCQARIQS